MLRRTATLALAFLAALTLGACGTTGADEDASDTTSTTTTESTTTTTTEPTTTTEDTEEVCDSLQEIADVIEEVGTAEDRYGPDWADLQPELIDIYERGLEAYTTAADVAPDEIQDDLATIRDNVEENILILQDSTSVADFSSKVSVNARAIQDEATRVNDYAKDTCGFPTVPGG